MRAVFVACKQGSRSHKGPKMVLFILGHFATRNKPFCTSIYPLLNLKEKNPVLGRFVMPEVLISSEASDKNTCLQLPYLVSHYFSSVPVCCSHC